MYRLLAACGLVVLVVFSLAAHIPATYLGGFCTESKYCLLTDLEGTIWNGSATLHIHDGTSWLAVPRVRWVVTMDGILRMTSGSAELEWIPGRIGWKLTVDKLTLDATILGAALPQPLPRTGWEGVITIPSLQWVCDWTGQDCEGVGHALWLRAGQRNLSNTLGNFEVIATATRGRREIGLTLKGEGGGLGLIGSGHIDSSTFQFGGEAWASGTDKDHIESMLNPIGQRSENGRYRLQLSKRFR